MGTQHPLPILVTGGGRRIGLAIAWHFINQKQPVIVSYRTHYPAIDGLTQAGALCIQADFSTDEGILAFADKVKEQARCAGTGTPPATSSILRITLWRKAATSISPTRQAKRRWII